MKYENEIRIHKDAVKFLKGLSPKLKERVKRSISSLTGFPLVRMDVVKLKGFENVYRLRIGRVRVLFEYHEKERIIFIRHIAFREKAY
jgi:mRNA interferase RelE/StbE